MPFEKTGPSTGSTVLPLLYDSPHSGRVYPDDFGTHLSMEKLQWAEDAFVDQIFAGAPDVGATLITANFPRLYIDPNRSLTDVDPSTLDGEWPEPLEPSDKARRGKGLVWETLHGTEPVYNRKLRVEEVQHRIDTYWQPYHDAVSGTLDDLHSAFGYVYHIDCHSMRAMGNSNDSDGPAPRPEFVVSDREGTSCDPEFTDLIYTQLKHLGFKPTINDPFKGAELTDAYSNPADNRHSLQIEINRCLYLKDEGYQKRDDFGEFCDAMQSFNRAVASFVTDKYT